MWPNDTVSIFRRPRLRPLRVPCLVGINADEGAFLTALLKLQGGIKRGHDNLASVLVLPKRQVEDVRDHYNFGEKAIDWAEDRLTWAISDGLFVHPFYRLLRTESVCYVYKYSHRGEASLPQLLSSASSKDYVSHFDEVLLQFNNKVLFLILLTSSSSSSTIILLLFISN